MSNKPTYLLMQVYDYKGGELAYTTYNTALECITSLHELGGIEIKEEIIADLWNIRMNEVHSLDRETLQKSLSDFTLESDLYAGSGEFTGKVVMIVDNQIKDIDWSYLVDECFPEDVTIQQQKDKLISKIAEYRVEQADLLALMDIYISYQEEVLENYSLDELEEIFEDI